MKNNTKTYSVLYSIRCGGAVFSDTVHSGTLKSCAKHMQELAEESRQTRLPVKQVPGEAKLFFEDDYYTVCIECVRA